MNWSRFTLHERVVNSQEAAIRWSQEHGLLRKEVNCTYHKTAMVFDINRGAMGQFRCQKKHPSNRRSSVSAAEGSWFEGHRLKLRNMYSLMYSFTSGDSYEAAVRELVDEDPVLTSSETIADWYSYCREVVIESFTSEQQLRGKIGGPGQIVQIDEAKFGRRKFHRGRYIEGNWILGMICNGSEDLRLEICPNNKRDSETLIPLIRKHVAPGSTIWTDEWRAYNCLPRFDDYKHETVCHAHEFVNDNTGVHTQRIESCWRPMRAYFRNKNTTNRDAKADHLTEYQWRRWCRKTKKDKFQDLIDSIVKLYPL